MTNFQLKPQMIELIKNHSQYLDNNQFVPFIRIAYNTIPFTQFRDDLPVVLHTLGIDLDKEFTQAAAEIICEEELPILKSEFSDKLLDRISVRYWKETTADHVLNYMLEHQYELKIRCVKLDMKGEYTPDLYTVRKLK